MTEEEWANCKEVRPLLRAVRNRLSHRKLRLFGCACCHRLLEFLGPGEQRRWLINEAYADGGTSTDDFVEAFAERDSNHYFRLNYIHFSRYAIASLGWSEIPEQNWTSNETAQAWVPHLEEPGAYEEFVTLLISSHAANAVGYRMTDTNPHSPCPDWDRLQAAMAIQISDQTAILRDLVGNPFRPVTLDPSWLTSTVVTLAQQMYDSRDFSPMPILADALQDAGCENEEVLNHCRHPGEHVRGCWIVDLLTGRK
jgi:hypothetical protein